ncbi:hypothetical protein C5167_043650 [Papaver somniferum]|uniref:Uncharacterized protein n=1 Tax=Papaver somniferum TaxID=3469 RepID=A0A4Y7L6A2_PAPSO|nr:hypothetical protein C5167_043650 [Papaver somniferum]
MRNACVVGNTLTYVYAKVKVWSTAALKNPSSATTSNPYDQIDHRTTINLFTSQDPSRIQKQTLVSSSNDFFLIKSTKSSVSASDPLLQNRLNHSNPSSMCSWKHRSEILAKRRSYKKELNATRKNAPLDTKTYVHLVLDKKTDRREKGISTKSAKEGSEVSKKFKICRLIAKLLLRNLRTSIRKGNLRTSIEEAVILICNTGISKSLCHGLSIVGAGGASSLPWTSDDGIPGLRGQPSGSCLSWSLSETLCGAKGFIFQTTDNVFLY